MCMRILSPRLKSSVIYHKPISARFSPSSLYFLVRSQQRDWELVSFPDHIFRGHWKNVSGQLPIPFSFKCTGMLAHCYFLI